MAKRTFNVIIERDDEGYYIGSVPELRGCHTQARSLDELMDRVREAIDACSDGVVNGSTEFIGVQRVTVDT